MQQYEQIGKQELNIQNAKKKHSINSFSTDNKNNLPDCEKFLWIFTMPRLRIKIKMLNTKGIIYIVADPK